MKVRVYNLRTGETIGTLSDASGKPLGDPKSLDEDLLDRGSDAERNALFDQYAAGWSNGYIATETAAK